jgi:transposase
VDRSAHRVRRLPSRFPVWALGRKNWIHFGSQQAGPRIAAILSIVETCRRLQIPIRDYLTAILPGLADLPVSRRC